MKRQEKREMASEGGRGSWVLESRAQASGVLGKEEEGGGGGGRGRQPEPDAV